MFEKQQPPMPEYDAIEEMKGLRHQETYKGLPVISEEEYRRLYTTDIRALGEHGSATFDFQGFLKGPGLEEVNKHAAPDQKFFLHGCHGDEWPLKGQKS